MQISRSQDDVSKRLATLFGNAIQPTEEEMQSARARKEKGNSPGKPSNPLGDEITWEQFLTHCRQQNEVRVWIVSRDGDYCTPYKKGAFVLNPMLYFELRQTAVSDIRCFGDLLAASEDFARDAGVTANTLPTEDEAKEIRKEIDALPPLYRVLFDDAGEATRLFLNRQAATAGTAPFSSMFANPAARED
jgi:hypothetical protein